MSIWVPTRFFFFGKDSSYLLFSPLNIYHVIKFKFMKNLNIPQKMSTTSNFQNPLIPFPLSEDPFTKSKITANYNIDPSSVTLKSG